MKTSQLALILIAVVLSCSCGQEKETNNSLNLTGYNTASYYDGENNQQNANDQYAKPHKSNNRRLKFYKVMNQQFGIPFGLMPIPISWSKSNNKKENVLFEGPKGVRVFGEQFSTFFYSNDTQRNQFAQQSGSTVEPVKSIERLLAENIKPFLQAQGLHFIRQYPLPQLAQFDKRFDSYIFKATPEKKHFQCVVTEWEDQQGKLSIGIVRYFVTQYTAIGGWEWGFTFNGMEAPKSLYEESKNAFVSSLINFQINPQWVQKNNHYYAQMAQQNNTGHQQRMAAIRAQGQQILATGKARSQAMDDQYNTWRNGQAASDRMQSSYVDGIWERSNMTDNSGAQYQIEGYDNNVWMNENNEYISTDDNNWNPNVDNTSNNYTWEQLQTTD